MAKFAQFAMVAAHEALEDAGWTPRDDEDQQATVNCSDQQTLASGKLKVYRVSVWALV